MYFLYIMDNLSQTNKILISVLILAVIFLTGIVASNEIKRGRYIGSNVKNTRTISVTGKEVINTEPDMVEVELTVWSEGKDLAEIQQENTAKMNKLNTFLKSKGLKKEDLTTTNYDIVPRFGYEDGKRKFQGYRITQSLKSEVNDFSKLGEILDESVKIGVNQIGKLQFTVDKKEKLKQQARNKAIKEAQEKAEKLASNLEVTLGALTNFSETNLQSDNPELSRKEVAEDKGGVPKIESGQTEIKKEVTLTYEIVQ